MDDRRNRVRTFMLDILPVSISGLGEGIGHLIDITDGGLMIRCGVPVEVGARQTLTVELKEPIMDSMKIELQAECLWCRQAPSLGGYNAGYYLVEPSSRTLASIQELTQVANPAIS